MRRREFLAATAAAVSSSSVPHALGRSRDRTPRIDRRPTPPREAMKSEPEKLAFVTATYVGTPQKCPTTC